MKLPLALGLAFTIVTGVPAAPASTWSNATTAHFDVYASAGDRRARDAAQQFERVHQFFAQFFHLGPERDQPTRVLVFNGQKEYLPYRPSEGAIAFYQPAADGDFIVMQSLDPDAYPVVVHEYAHLIARRAGSEFPNWLSEGLAEFLSTITPSGRQMKVGLAPSGRLGTLSRSPNLFPLARLFAVTNSSPEYNNKDLAQVFYAESWALTHMLIGDERYHAKAADVIDAIGHGAPSAETLVSAYGRPLDAITKDLQTYVEKESYAFKFVDSAPIADDAIKARPATDLEVGTVEAAVLGCRREREADARRAFDAVAAQGANDVRWFEARGLFESQQGADAARPFLEKAVALKSTNPVVLERFALTLRDDSPESLSLLEQALDLAPSNFQIRFDLARMQINLQHPNDAIATLTSVTHVPRTQAFDLFMWISRAALAASKPDQAIEAGKRAMLAATTPGETEIAADLQSTAQRAASMKVAAGSITNVICGSPTVFELTTTAGTMKLVVDNPTAMRVTGIGADAGTTEFQCGRQDRKAEITFAPANGYDGAIRAIVLR